jgi:HAAS domain-containing protein
MSGSRPIEDYLDKLRRELPGGRRFKRRVLSEVEDHLREGVWHEQEGGVPALEAERRVIERFGSPRLLARRFAEDLTGGGARTAARTMLLAMFGVMVLRFLPSPALGELLGMPANGFFEPPGPWPGDVLPPHLRPAIDVAQFALLAALAAGVFALWRVRRHGRGTGIPRGDLPVVVSATVLAFAAFAVSGVADTAFMFQRAEAIPGSPSTLVHAVFAAVRALITAAGGYFVVRAVLRLRSLRRLRTN